MALANIFGWNEKEETPPSAACGTACGTACGAGDKPEGSNCPGDDCSEQTETEGTQPAACGTACGASDK